VLFIVWIFKIAILFTKFFSGKSTDIILLNLWAHLLRFRFDFYADC